MIMCFKSEKTKKETALTTLSDNILMRNKAVPSMTRSCYIGKIDS